jgi:molecular chaperone GrpE
MSACVGTKDTAALGTGRADAASNPGVTSAAHVPQYQADPGEPGEPPDPYGLLARTVADRTTLVRLCLYALDRARSDGVAERIERGLAGVGVTAVRPDGRPFDPALHEAAGTTVTDDDGLVGLIAATEVAGFIDNGRPLRAPVVVVYRSRDGA